MEFKEVVKARYSCRSYIDRQVSEEALKAILEAGRLAPTAKNLQEHHVYVLQSEEALAKVDAWSHCRFGAPTVLAVTYDKNNVYTYPGSNRQSGIEDAAIVATHMMLAAKDEGVDSCWLNAVHMDELHEALGLPENEDIVMLLDLGYASLEGLKPAWRHFERKPLSETVTFM
ncbi:MAG: nitroreductase family protein [Bacteroidaceae bacterium]|jgi:nitroreductase|nr:nitroreductase family protein [Bacteroidaceae bacterium]MBR7052949.1 nitroreductase family protein [Bacteroidaceae bacterium]